MSDNIRLTFSDIHIAAETPTVVSYKYGDKSFTFTFPDALTAWLVGCALEMYRETGSGPGEMLDALRVASKYLADAQKEEDADFGVGRRPMSYLDHVASKVKSVLQLPSSKT